MFTRKLGKADMVRKQLCGTSVTCMVHRESKRAEAKVNKKALAGKGD